AVDEQVAVLVEVADVARRHQAADHVLAAAAGVALELHLVADEDAPGLARPLDLVALLVVELDDGPARRLARAAGRLAQVRGRGDRRPRDLGRAVEVVEDVAEEVHRLRGELAGSAEPDAAMIRSLRRSYLRMTSSGSSRMRWSITGTTASTSHSNWAVALRQPSGV